MESATYKHILLVPMIMWGHTRPMCTLAARLVKLRPNVAITIFVSIGFYERAKAEIARDFRREDEHLTSKIIIMRLEQTSSPWDAAAYEADFLDTWAKFLDGQPLNGHAVDGTPRQVTSTEKDRLSAVVIDMFAIRTFDTFQNLKENLKVKVYTWYPSAISSMFCYFVEDYIPRAQELATQKGVSFDVAAHEIMFVPNGRLMRTRCLPLMYDYEYHPQAAFSVPEFSGRILIQVHRVLKATDGLITIDAADYHPATTMAARAWFAPRAVHYAGPLVPISSDTTSADKDAAAVMQFLDAHLESHGPKSAILISFGSMFWPADPAKVGAMLDTLMEKNVPFVLSRCSALADIPKDTEDKLAKCPHAFVSSWIPQQAVLSHAATGWCLTHAGVNTVFECIFADVPMILWPIDADQPPNAIHLTEDLSVAYELLEVRNGTGLGTIYRTRKTPNGTIAAVKSEVLDVLARAFGSDGDKKRVRLSELKSKLQRAWEQDGEAWQDLVGFLANV
ncbi:UDP-Glycosyltransferase/glycogen phosphorylase [Cubamyces sp. BRFM 1775]|nr:UDP-Glycosyltransferase/glycogen phosphorylase [Cubamyces sp. BRFM 1775]